MYWNLLWSQEGKKNEEKEIEKRKKKEVRPNGRTNWTGCVPIGKSEHVEEKH